MQTLTNQFTPLEQVTRPTVPTADAAHYLNRRPQTLRAGLARSMAHFAQSVSLAVLRGKLLKFVPC